MNDLFNLDLVTSAEEVDQINKQFYGRYNYPWQAAAFPLYPPGIGTQLLNQDLGYWQHDRIPQQPRIWVAGCGTNQALFTALKFPQATVVGTDISVASLEVCKRNAEQMQVKNLALEECSLNDVRYKDAFDYIICTGVVHHNASPGETLSNISKALTKNGVLELMVYNYYHRLMTTACQKAVRAFYEPGQHFDMEGELSLLKQIMQHVAPDNIMGQYLQSQLNNHEAAIADSLLQPVEYSYTIKSLEKMANESNLEYLVHCLNRFDIDRNTLQWNMSFNNAELQARYDALPDTSRWQIANLLLFNDSPMLWFYFQRKDAGMARRSEQSICEEFLHTRFRAANFPLKKFVLSAKGDYVLSDKMAQTAAAASDPVLNRILQTITPDKTMKDIFQQLNIAPTFRNINLARLRLTTSAFPYLLSIPDQA